MRYVHWQTLRFRVPKRHAGRREPHRDPEPFSRPELKLIRMARMLKRRARALTRHKAGAVPRGRGLLRHKRRYQLPTATPHISARAAPVAAEKLVRELAREAWWGHWRG